VHYYKISPSGYHASALIAVLRNDGPTILKGVLRALGLESSADLIADMEKRK
jgi:hypothetical protein